MTTDSLVNTLLTFNGIINISRVNSNTLAIAYHNPFYSLPIWHCTLSHRIVNWDRGRIQDFPKDAFDVLKEYCDGNNFDKENTNMSDNDINAKIKKDVKQLAKDLNDKKRYDQNTSTAKRILHNLESEYGLSFKSKKSKSKSRKDN